MPTRRRLIAGFKRTPLKVVVSIVTLSLVIYWIGPENLLTAFKQGDPRYFAATFAVIMTAQLISAYKWMLIVKSNGGEFGLFSAVRIYFVGMFMNNFLPTGFGGDATRALLSARRNNISIGVSTWTVFFDRASGLLTLIVLGLVVSGWYFGGLPGLVAGSGVLLAGSVAWLIVRRRWNGLNRDRHMGRLIKVLLYPLKNSALESVLAISVVFNSLYVLSILLVFLGFGVQLDLRYVVITSVVLSLGQLVPVFIGGFGAREIALVTILAPVGVEGETAAAMGLTLGLISSAVSLGGAIMFVLDGGQPDDRSMSAQLDHKIN